MKFFRRDLIILLVISILLGTIAARGVALAADIYFKDTITGMVGEYGEYDLLLQLREENKTEALSELNRILQQEFKGAEYKEGPSLVQKVNIFVALPVEYKNREIYENIEKNFVTIPGGVGLSIITEPRINIRALPAGIIDDLAEKLSALPGVDFVYRNGSNLGIVITDGRRIQSINTAVEDQLASDKLLEISFPKGSEPPSPQAAADKIIRLMQASLGIEGVYVSQDKNSEELARLIIVMQELQSFLKAYQSKLFINTTEKLAADTLLVLPTKGRPSLRAGAEYAGQAVARIEYLKQPGVYQAVLVNGDSSELSTGQAYYLNQENVGAELGSFSWHNPREALTSAAVRAAAAINEIPALSKASHNISAEALAVLDSYEANKPLLRRTLNNMETAEIILANAADKIVLLGGAETRVKLDKSLASLDRLIKNMRFISWFSADAATTIATMQEVRANLTGIRQLLGEAAILGSEAEAAGRVLDSMQSDIARFDTLLANISRSELTADLNSLENIIDSLGGKNNSEVIEALQLLEGNLPQLRDDDIAASLNTINRLLNGQAIPEKRLQIKVPRNVTKEAVRPLMAEGLGQDSFGLFEAELGVIEPNIYAQGYQILSEVHAVLAGLTALAVTILFLALDHTLIAAALKWRYQYSVAGLSGGTLYCSLIGAVLWSSIYGLAGAAIPYVNFMAVIGGGALVGLLFGLLAERFSPLDRSEILAAESLGAGFDAIMHEIIIPAGRPGLLVRLNRSWQKF